VTWRWPAGRHIPRLSAELRQRDTVKPLELFFDLVFVVGFTQCTALMSSEHSWGGIARGLAVLGLLWWAWAGFAWLTSTVDPEEGSVRIAMFGTMAAILIAALCVPEAFGDRALPFAIAYAGVRGGNLVLYGLASRDDPALRRSVVVYSITTSTAAGFILAAAFADGAVTAVLWGLALLLDGGGPAVVPRTMEGWRLTPAHFAERHNLVILIALGESIVALGVAAEADLTAGVYLAAALGIAVASAIWWIYFDIVALVTEQRLVRATPGLQRNLLARDSYSYLHFPMVAGIVLAAFGLEATLAHVDDPLDRVAAFALLGGIAVYLLAHVVLRLRNAHTLNRQRFVLAIALLALWPLAKEIDALATLVVVTVLIWAMIVYELGTYDERRYQLRHGIDVDPPGR
jgi:low temperature requirement protein LtrA